MNFLKSKITLKEKSAWEEPGRQLYCCLLLQTNEFLLIAVYSLHRQCFKVAVQLHCKYT